MSEQPEARYGFVNFADLTEALRGEVIDAATTYGLLTGLVHPIIRQQMFHDHYPLMAHALSFPLTRHLISTVCRIFGALREAAE